MKAPWLVMGTMWLVACGGSSTTTDGGAGAAGKGAASAAGAAGAGEGGSGAGAGSGAGGAGAGAGAGGSGAGAGGSGAGAGGTSGLAGAGAGVAGAGAAGAGTGGSGAASGAGGASASAGAAGVGGASGAGGATGCGVGAVVGDHDLSLVHGGIVRTYRVHVPPAGAKDPTPLVFVFHGNTETSQQIQDISLMTAKADAHGFVVVYPQGYATSWNAGKCCGAAEGIIDDVGFFDAMMTTLTQSLCVDEKRVFAAGLSNGAMLTQRLGCERASVVAAIAPVAGPLVFSPCTPARPVPVLEFHGTADPVVPIEGGGASGAGPVKDTITFWSQSDSCTDVAHTVYQNGDVTCAASTACAAGAAVELCTIDGGGHQWPGGTSAGPYGKISTDIDASEAMVAFFAAHPMP